MNRIKTIANWKTISILGAILLFFFLYLFPKYHAKINDSSGQEVETLDVRFTYTKIDVDKTFELMGTEGRKTYKFISACIDMIYPIVYGLLFLVVLLKLNKENSNRKLKLVYLFPLFVVLLDYTENVGILHMLNRYPSISEFQVNFNSLITSLKWIFVLITILLILVLSVSNFTKAYKIKRNQMEK